MAQEVQQVVGDVVLNGGTVTNGVHGAKRRAIEAEMCIGFEGMFVGLSRDGIGDGLAEVGLC